MIKNKIPIPDIHLPGRGRLNSLKKFAHQVLLLPFLTISAMSIFTAAAFLMLNNGHSSFKPIDSYIVIISHDNEQQIVPTKEPTVGSLLQKLSIKLNLGDVVEPSLSTPITQDNFRINIYRAVPVEIVVGDEKTFTFSAATTARSIADQAGIKVYPEDYVNLVPVSNFLTQQTLGEQVVVVPATPINLNIYGTPTVVRTHATTVAGLLADAHISLGAGDSVEPSAATELNPNAQVFLIHHGTQIQTVEQTIAMPVQTILDNSLSFGTSAVRQQGSNGQELLTYQLNLVNGAVVSKTLIQTVVTQPPVTEIVAEGQAVQIPSDITAVMAEAGIPSADYPYVNYIVSNESGWCPTKWQGEVGYCPGYFEPTYSISDGPGYGLGQATPADKMAPFGSDWETNPVTQLEWATSYADGRYGSWEAAYQHWYDYHNW
jgi:uncharacterized protein YabE (DUF348 family)